MRLPRVGAAALLSAALVSSCGSSANHARATAITVLTAKAPASLDPGVAFGERAMEVDWLAYTPLLTYAHASGVTGTRLIPGLATDLPAITGSGTTYSFELRRGLVYSNGLPVRASDFTWAVERAIKLGWPGARRYILGHVVGASAFADGRARTISGINTDDAARQITIRLASAYGQFEDVLALPALAPVPPSTPWRDERAAPPPGVGPYQIANVIPDRSYSLLHNLRWAQLDIPGIPGGRLDLHFRVSPDQTANALAVLHSRADALDPADPIPQSIFARLDARAESRHLATAADATYAVVMSTASKPFSSALAREAVVGALGEQSVERVTGGTLAPGCYLLPPPMAGHPSASCSRRGDVAGARALVARSGLTGSRVAVSNRAGSPAGGLASYYVSLLDRIGFRASYGSGTPQSEIELLAPDLPNPVAVYQQLGPSGYDPHTAAQLHVLDTVPAGQATAVSALWQSLDEYTARTRYVAVLGYPTVSALVSSRIDPDSVILHPVVGIDWSWLDLK
jgi:peptide/nickel transport system substrate-binding protein